MFKTCDYFWRTKNKYICEVSVHLILSNSFKLSHVTDLFNEIDSYGEGGGGGAGLFMSGFVPL